MKRSSGPLVTTYILSLVITVALLVLWVIYVVRSVNQIRAAAGRVGLSNPNTHWIILTVGAVMLGLLLGGLIYQLAQALAANRYTRKQEEFVSNITHEMKSPLAAIKLHAQTLEEPDLEPEIHDKSVAFILEQANRLGSLIDDVLESSRLLSRKKVLRLKPVELTPLLEEYLPGMAERARDRHGVALVWTLQTSATIMGSRTALERIMTNLIENAQRFSHRGGEIRCRVTDRRLVTRIVVEDDGIGIPKTDLGKVFDRFYQIGREIDGRRKGTGIGLSIVSGLVREMGGTVRAFSHEGRPGTRFVVELPILERTP
jgi:two-component system sensor histidine kinase VicK